MKSTETEMTYGSDYTFIPMTSIKSGAGCEILPDLYSHTLQVVNIVMIGDPDTEDFVLVDAGMPGSANEIISAAEKRFGSSSRPRAIILTHGHFDHVGAAIELIQHWQIPVYAHAAELPFLSGCTAYPAPDWTVEGGLLAKIAAIYPNEPIHLGHHVHALPEDGSVPELPEFRWIHTPGHTPGHISLFRESDRALIAGDAFITVRQDSVYKVVTQELEISGPPRYLTTDWQAAKASVIRLEALKPAAAVTGHGQPMTGSLLTESLTRLVREFDQLAIPDHGRYV